VVAGGVRVDSTGQRQLMPRRRRPAFHTVRARGGIGVAACRATRAQQLAFGEGDEEWRVLGVAVAVINLVVVLDDQRVHIGFWRLQNGYSDVRPSARVTVYQAALGFLHLKSVVAQLLFDRALQMTEGEYCLHKAR